MTSLERQFREGAYHDAYFEIDPRSNPDLKSSAQGKVVLITGSGRGIGRKMAEFFAHAGAEALVLVALEEDEVKETVSLCKTIKSNLKTATHGFDVTKTDVIKKCVDDTYAQFGRIDVLCCNAGIPPQFLSVGESDPAIWWRVMEVHLKHTFDFAHFVLPKMQRQKSGRIIFTSSNGAHGNAFASSYVLAKLSITRLSEIIHNEAYEDGVRCFSFHPGALPTRFLTDFQEKAQGKEKAGNYAGGNSDDQLKSAKEAVRVIEPMAVDKLELPAGLVVWMASGKGDFLSGRFVDASVDVKQYEKEQKEIKANDLWRVRLNKGNGDFMPTLSF